MSYDNNYRVERIEGTQRSIYLKPEFGNEKIIQLSGGAYQSQAAPWSGYEEDIHDVWVEGPIAYVQLYDSARHCDHIARFNLDTNANYTEFLDDSPA